ncbi:adhesive plaque matrix protein-like [Planoprotostelium fungivorum]|uniref:Adhesive plaque matrix protein-like n=1 Tax=Planoprotostelium fungivorum TaxID=1890364 RepID=A0A2P6N897_9EUKA|nr:adhesive plaque matrix protein-like [Planoprotostelium fungivorum]
MEKVRKNLNNHLTHEGPSQNAPGQQQGPSHNAPGQQAGSITECPGASPSSVSPAQQTPTLKRNGPAQPATQNGPAQPTPTTQNSPAQPTPTSQNGPSQPATQNGPGQQTPTSLNAPGGSPSSQSPTQQSPTSQNGPAQPTPTSQNVPAQPATQNGPGQQTPTSLNGPAQPATQNGPGQPAPTSQKGPIQQTPTSQNGPAQSHSAHTHHVEWSSPACRSEQSWADAYITERSSSAHTHHPEWSSSAWNGPAQPTPTSQNGPAQPATQNGPAQPTPTSQNGLAQPATPSEPGSLQSPLPMSQNGPSPAPQNATSGPNSPSSGPSAPNKTRPIAPNSKDGPLKPDDQPVSPPSPPSTTTIYTTKSQKTKSSTQASTTAPPRVLPVRMGPIWNPSLPPPPINRPTPPPPPPTSGPVVDQSIQTLNNDVIGPVQAANLLDTIVVGLMKHGTFPYGGPMAFDEIRAIMAHRFSLDTTKPYDVGVTMYVTDGKRELCRSFYTQLIFYFDAYTDASPEGKGQQLREMEKSVVRRVSTSVLEEDYPPLDSERQTRLEILKSSSQERTRDCYIRFAQQTKDVIQLTALSGIILQKNVEEVQKRDTMMTNLHLLFHRDSREAIVGVGFHRQAHHRVVFDLKYVFYVLQEASPIIDDTLFSSRSASILFSSCCIGATSASWSIGASTCFLAVSLNCSSMNLKKTSYQSVTQ